MRPLLLGHRGCRPYRRGQAPLPPENSLAAFEAALARGCDGFELDLRLTADGAIVVHHDARVAGLPIAHAKLAELRMRAPHLATIEQVLQRFSRRAWIDLEVKAPGLEALLLAHLRRRPISRGHVISSFSPRILRRFAALGGAPLCLNLRRPRTRARLARPAWMEAVEWIAPHQQFCTGPYIHRLRAAGWRTLVWTVNRPTKMRLLARAGAEAIVSDDPGLLVATLRD